MTRYAEGTRVGADRSRAEIERTLMRYGASAFGYGWLDEGTKRAAKAAITFVYDGKHVRLVLPLPVRESFRYTPNSGQERSVGAWEQAYDQAVRQRWRALALVIKAKLEAVETGIVSFEDEFLAHMVLPSGDTVGEWFTPQLEEAYRTGLMPAGMTLALPPANDNIVDMESR